VSGADWQKMRLRRIGADVGYGNPVNDCLAAAELLQQVRHRLNTTQLFNSSLIPSLCVLPFGGNLCNGGGCPVLQAS
jgi:hypothetical protein